LKAPASRGLTLVEVLVALSALALMTLMSHQALDLLLRSQFGAERQSQQMSSLQIGLAQWRLDLDRLDRTPYVNALQWDGQVLRLLRRSSSGDALLVVAWTVEDGLWRRWQSPPLRDREGLLQAWIDSLAAIRKPLKGPQSDPAGPGRLTDVLPVQAWALEFAQQGRSSPIERGDTRLREPPNMLRLRLIGLTAAGLSGPLQVDCAL
jgi:general secretion pathway protein J